MYQRLSAVLFPIVAVALVATGLWGYQEHQEKNSILIKAENQYQRAFHDLSYYMGQLKEELGKTMAVGTTAKEYQQRHLIQVWRITSQAQNQISQLPLALLPFHKTQEFLDKIANFTYRTSIRDLGQNPLTPDEQKTLMTLYERSKELSEEIHEIQAVAMKDHLRWMDVEMALASEHSPMDNAIIDGFKTVDNKVTEYSEVNWGPSVQSLYDKREAKPLSAPVVNEEQIRRKALRFLGLNGDANLQIVENGKGTEYESYSVTLETERGPVSLDFSKRGGELLWYMNPREVTRRKLSIEEAREKAENFLRNNGYGETTPINYDQYNNVGSLTFAASENGIVYYPKKLTVSVALDNGEITGLQAHDFVYGTDIKPAGKPKLNREEAAKFLHPTFSVKSSGLAFIENDLEEEVLCYEFTGKINGSDYRIFINAENGAEEKVETIKPAEAAFGQERS